jgi:hypothetical protein
MYKMLTLFEENAFFVKEIVVKKVGTLRGCAAHCSP